jgi:hypothetical protein
MVSFLVKQRGAVIISWFVLLLLPTYSICQNDLEPFEIDENVVLNMDSTTSSVLKVWKSYLINKENIDSVKKYWSEEERTFFSDKWVDARYRYLDYSSIRDIHNFYKPYILGVKEKEKNEYVIRNLYYHYFEKTKRMFFSYAYNIYVIKEKNKFSLQSALYNNIKKAESKKSGTVTGYKFGKLSKYTLHNLDTLDKININLAKLYGCIPIDIKVILAESTELMMQATGYDYERSMYYANQSNAFSEPVNRLVFIAGTDENFLHELCHLYTHHLYSPNLYDRTYHNFIDEGLSTLFGGSVGIPLIKHLKKIYNFDVKYPIDFNNLASLRGGIDNVTFYNCCIGGLLCKVMYDREGMQGVSKLLKGGTSDEALYRTIETVIGIKRSELNKFIHDELKKYAD